MKIKRWVSAFLCILLCIGMMPAMALAADDTEGRFLENNGVVAFYQNVTAQLPQANPGYTYEIRYELNQADHTAKLTGASGNSADYAGAELAVLETIVYQDEKYTVTTIGTEAFRYSEVRSVHLPESITTIEDSAFIYCYYLEEINLPDGLTFLGTNAFWTCHALKEIHIPAGITEIPNGAFTQCWGVTEFTIPSHVTAIGKEAFEGLGNQSGAKIDLVIPENVITIGYEAFGRTEAIKSVTVAKRESGTNLQLNGAFRVCNGLESVTILSPDVTIGDNEFQSCPALASISLPDGLTTIGKFAFNHSPKDAPSYALQEVVIPASVTSLGNAAFAYCRGAVVYYPSSIQISDSDIYTLGFTKTRVKYTTNTEDGSVRIDSVEGEALEKTPGTIGGKKVSAVPAEYQQNGKHVHYFGMDDSLAFCGICKEPNPAHEHEWSTPVWEWAADYSGATASFVCTSGAGHTEELAATVSEQRVDATCTANGAVTYTASVNQNGVTYTDVQTVVLAAAGHAAIHHEAKAPTASAPGNIEYWYCPNCGTYFRDAALTQEIAEEQTILAATPTEPQQPSSESEPADTPQTGDSGNAVFWLVLVLAAGTALAGTVVYHRKYRA